MARRGVGGKKKRVEAAGVARIQANVELSVCYGRDLVDNFQTISCDSNGVAYSIVAKALTGTDLRIGVSRKKRRVEICS